MQLPIPPPGPQPIEGNVPLAAAYLKLFARRKGLDDFFQIELLPPPLANTLGDQGLVEEILSRQPWMAGFTCYLWNIERTLWIAQRLKQRRPDLKIVLGGPEITADNAWVLEHAAVDYAVIGEGEPTFAELLAALREETDAPGSKGPNVVGTLRVPNRNAERAHYIAGLWTRSGGKPAPRAPLADLDAVASPYLEGILDAADERLMLLESVRGCRFRCKFCYYPKNYDTPRLLSAEQIAASLRHAAERGAAEVFLLDPTLNQRRDFADFLRLLARCNPERRLAFSGELRAEGIDAETARLMRLANFKEVEVGLQSVDPRAQRLMGRTTNLKALEVGAKAMLAEAIKVRIDLMIGLPGDTVDSVRRGIDYLQLKRPFSEVQVFHLSILPGTAFRQQAEQLGLVYQTRPPYYVLKTPTLDVEQMYLLMAEAQEALGVEFDTFPLPQLEHKRGRSSFWTWGLPRFSRSENGTVPFRSTESISPPIVSGCKVDLDVGPQVVPPAPQRAQAFTLWLCAADFRQRRQEAAALVGRVIADNPHTTLQVVVEPSGDPACLTAAALETLLAACHPAPSYLDWYYSLHPGHLPGAKRLMVLVPIQERARLGRKWIERIGNYATLLWRGGDGGAEDLEEHEYLL